MGIKPKRSVSYHNKILSFSLYHELGEEALWLEEQLSPHTRRAYRGDIEHFMRSLDISSRNSLLKVTRSQVVLWRRLMEEAGLKSRTIQRRLAALSSLFSHLLGTGKVTVNPVTAIKRPPAQGIGSTKAFSVDEAQKLLEAPPKDTLIGKRDRAIIALLIQGGLRRAEVASLLVRDIFTEQGSFTILFTKKGGREHKIFLHYESGERVMTYLAAAGHKNAPLEPLFQATKGRFPSGLHGKRSLSPKQINNIVKRYAIQVTADKHYSSHSCRTTFITHALKSGATLEEVQKTVGHANPATTQGYDRNIPDPKRSATRFSVTSSKS
jgi:site-specific recombinase XerD